MKTFPVVVAWDGSHWRAARKGPSANAALVEVFGSEVGVPDGFRVTRGDGNWLPSTFSERRIEVDQTNDSWVVSDTIVIKWVTEPLVGPHPAPERLRRLQEAGFAATPRLHGMVEWRSPEGDWVPVASAFALIPEAVDGWEWCVEAARVDLGLREGAPIPFARALGTLTAQLHLALADSATGPVADHGDLHVGQILRTPSGDLFVIDFDGNPTLSPPDRAKHRPAAYDVAGMMVSLENVGHVVEHYDPHVGAAAIIAWTEQVHEEFLAAYVESASGLLDASLLPGFVLDQIHRELAYADSHLPAWRYVPEAALRRRGLL